MTRHALGPYQLRIKYAYAGRAHTMTLEVDAAVGNEGPTGYIIYGSSPAYEDDAGVQANLLQAAMRPSFSTAVSFNSWELWHAVDAGSPAFMVGGTFDNPSGGSAQNAVPYGMAVFTYRTGLFGRYRMQLMESVYLLNEVHGYGDFTAGDARKVLIDYVLSGASIVKGRDGARPTNFIRVSTKTSDALRRRYIMGF